MFLTTVYSLCLACLLGIFSVSSTTCPTNSGTRCIGTDYCPGSYITGASCVEGYCRCHGSSKYHNCTCLPHVSGCLIKRSPSTYVGLPSTDGRPEMPYYGCVSSLLNCDYEVHVFANYESSNGHHGFGIPRVAGSTYIHFNISGQSSKPLVLVFTSHEPVNWVLSLPSGVVVNRILVGGYHTSKIVGNPATNVEVVPHNKLSLQSGHGPDDGGGSTADTLIYLTNRFGPISSFSGSYRADRWNVNIERSPACNSSDPPKSAMVRFEKERYTVNEGAGSVTLVLLITHPNPNNTTVLYSTTNETALAPMDYTAANQILINFPAGYSQLELTIPIRDDDLYELSETFQVQVLLPNKPVPAVVEIIDNDPIVARFYSHSYIFSNNIGQGTVAVEIIGHSEVDIILQYSVTDNRARVTHHSITIPAGSNRIKFNVSINNVQINGPLQVKLVNDTTHGVAVGVPNQATIEINNGQDMTPTTIRITDQEMTPTTIRITDQEMTPTTIRITDQEMTPTTTHARESITAGAIAGGFVLTAILIVFYIAVHVRIRRTRPQHARATSTHVAHSSNSTTTSTGSILLSTQPHPPPPTTGFNLPQPQPQSAPVLTFTQPSNPSITEVPPPAYHLHETFAIYSENKKPSDDPPPYHPPSYNAATEKTKCKPLNTPQD